VVKDTTRCVPTITRTCKVSHLNSASLLWRCSACRELLKHLGFADMLPPAPEAEPTLEESLAATEATLGRLSTQGDEPSLGASSPVADPDADAAPAPVGSTLSGEDFFSNLGGAGAENADCYLVIPTG